MKKLILISFLLITAGAGAQTALVQDHDIPGRLAASYNKETEASQQAKYKENEERIKRDEQSSLQKAYAMGTAEILKEFGVKANGHYEYYFKYPQYSNGTNSIYLSGFSGDKFFNCRVIFGVRDYKAIITDCKSEN
ncbi:MAG: hypothetical protein ACAH59_07860 [Pseudobdellovibrionaceae bacterium]